MRRHKANLVLAGENFKSIHLIRILGTWITPFQFLKYISRVSGEKQGLGGKEVFHFLLYTFLSQKKVVQLCPTLCHPTDCSPPGSSIHGILQARTLEWVAMPFSRGSPQPRDETWVSCFAGGFFTVWATS